jgi:transcriptional regulator
MYIPSAFSEADPKKLFELIEQNSFGLLVSQHGGEPFATHLPLLLDRTAGPYGSLIGHMARANPQWQSADGQAVLAVFSGPHAYISPTWYESDNVVPTWNYVAVHAYGTFHAVHDAESLLAIVGQYVDFFESSLPQPWKFNPASDYSRKMIGAIVGFRIEISRLEGKWKLNQNHPRERREKVVRALDASGDELSMAVADLMECQLAQEPAVRNDK